MMTDHEEYHCCVKAKIKKMDKTQRSTCNQLTSVSLMSFISVTLIISDPVLVNLHIIVSLFLVITGVLIVKFNTEYPKCVLNLIP